MVFCFLSLTELTRFSVKFCVVKFSSFGLSYDGLRKDVKILSLGLPWHPKLLSKNEQPTKLGDAPRVASSLSSNKYRYFTRDYIFIRHMICVLLGACFQFYLLLNKIIGSEILNEKKSSHG